MIFLPEVSHVNMLEQILSYPGLVKPTKIISQLNFCKPPVSHWCECLWPNHFKQPSWGWPEDPESLVSPLLTARHRGAQLAFARKCQNWQVWHWCPVLFTDVSPLSSCDRQERVCRSCGERYTACNVVQHDWFGGGSVLVWGGMSIEGRTELDRINDGTLTAIR